MEDVVLTIQVVFRQDGTDQGVFTTRDCSLAISSSERTLVAREHTTSFAWLSNPRRLFFPVSLGALGKVECSHLGGALGMGPDSGNVS